MKTFWVYTFENFHKSYKIREEFTVMSTNPNMNLE